MSWFKEKEPVEDVQKRTGWYVEEFDCASRARDLPPHLQTLEQAGWEIISVSFRHMDSCSLITARKK